MCSRAYVNLNWERTAGGALSPYLSIARHGQPAERIPLTTQDVARLLADGAYLWSVVEPVRQGLSPLPSRYNPPRSDDTSVTPPHFIGAWGE